MAAAAVWFPMGRSLDTASRCFFVLAILLHIPEYQAFLKNKEQRQSAKVLSVYACVTVLSFQLFTMFTFGRGQIWGVLFVLFVFLFAGLSFSKWRSLTKIHK